MQLILADPSQNMNGRRQGRGARRASPHGLPGRHAKGMPAAGGKLFALRDFAAQHPTLFFDRVFSHATIRETPCCP